MSRQVREKELKSEIKQLVESGSVGIGLCKLMDDWVMLDYGDYETLKLNEEQQIEDLLDKGLEEMAFSYKVIDLTENENGSKEVYEKLMNGQLKELAKR